MPEDVGSAAVQVDGEDVRPKAGLLYRRLDGVARLLAPDEGSLKYLETVGRDRPTNSEKSSIVLICLVTVEASPLI